MGNSRRLSLQCDDRSATSLGLAPAICFAVCGLLKIIASKEHLMVVRAGWHGPLSDTGGFYAASRGYMTGTMTRDQGP